ncbi:MAG TPA: hypothetical protein VH301_02405 [Usitatibacter sp.]|nr:hypothetical protein [Usitatibacter sp.]
MKPMRSFLLAAAFAVALLASQQVWVLHDLDHAKSQLSQKGGKPGSQVCEQCFMCAGLAGAPGAQPPSVSEPQCGHERVLAYCDDAILSQPLLNFRSRAPPTLI